MKQVVFTILGSILLALSSSSQPNSTKEANGNTSQTSFYAELGGPGLLFSANIDKRFNSSSHLGWGGRIGLGFVSGYIIYDQGNMYDRPASVVTIPIQINHIFGKSTSPHTFEVGAGITIAGRKLDIFDFYDERRSSFFGTASFMYRRQPANGGFTWRAGFTPLIAQGYIQAFGGVGVGYNF